MVNSDMGGVPFLLSGGAPRSEHDPDLEVSTARVEMHPFTGAFADPAHELAFAAQLYRLAFPLHVFLLAVGVSVYAWCASAAFPDVPPAASLFNVVVIALGLVGRVLLHRMHDSVLSQRLGSWSWAVLMCLSCGTDMISAMTNSADGPAPLASQVLGLATALMNGTHGMGVVLKFALIAVVLVDFVVVLAISQDAEFGPMLYTVGMVVFGAAAAHIAELHWRHSYAEKTHVQDEDTEKTRRLEERMEQLQTSNERLLYDVQRRGGPLEEDDRSAIRRGLQAGPCRPYHLGSESGSSGVGAPDSSALPRKPRGSPPASIPPAPPSTSFELTSEASVEQLCLAAHQLVGLQASAGGKTNECKVSSCLHLVPPAGRPIGHLVSSAAAAGLATEITGREIDGAGYHRSTDAAERRAETGEQANAGDKRCRSAVDTYAFGGVRGFLSSPLGNVQAPNGLEPSSMATPTPEQEALQVARCRSQTARTDLEVPSSLGPPVFPWSSTDRGLVTWSI